jgi:hypothetical protein
MSVWPLLSLLHPLAGESTAGLCPQWAEALWTRSGSCLHLIATTTSKAQTGPESPRHLLDIPARLEVYQWVMQVSTSRRSTGGVRQEVGHDK